MWDTGQRSLSSDQIGYGSWAQRVSVWSKSVAQSVTGGFRCGVVIGSVLHGDGALGAVGGGQGGLLLQLGRQVAVDQDDGEALVVDVEHLGRQRVAAAVALALLLIELDAHPSPQRTVAGAARRPPSGGGGAAAADEATGHGAGVVAGLIGQLAVADGGQVAVRALDDP